MASDAVELARRLIATDSRNPTLAPGAPGESAAAKLLGETLESWGFAVEITEAAPGRPNLVARIGRGERTLMLAGHLDTVGVEGMSHEPFEPRVSEGRLYGRGSADMKGGIAAMCAAGARAATARTQVIVAAVCDEEYESRGMRSLLAAGMRADAAIVAEPTRLAICPAHRGFVWVAVKFRGRAAHGSRHDIGVDAITHAGLFLAELETLESQRLPRRTHALLGRASVHASTISGGTGLSTYPGECVLKLERRTLPGETADGVIAEIRDVLDRARARSAQIDADVQLIEAQLPCEVDAGAPIVRALAAAVEAEGIEPRIEGLSAWTDAALLNEAGIPAVCFGPGDISLAHAAEEYVPVREIETAMNVLERVVREWGA